MKVRLLSPVQMEQKCKSQKVELYYERCGVGVLDLGYPSNHFTFGEVVEDTPMIIFRKPYAIHQMFHIEHLHNDKVHFQVDQLHKWGYVFPADDLGK